MLRASAFSLLFAAIATLAGAQEAPPTPLVNAWVRGEGTTSAKGSEGQGFFLKGAEGCVLVTAGHVVQGSPFVSWRVDGVAGRGRVDFHQYTPGQLDIAFVKILDGGPKVCPDAPSPQLVTARRAAGGLGEVAISTEANARSFTLMSVDEDRPKFLVKPSSGSESVKSGWSGAPLRMGGVVVGLLINVGEQRRAQVQLLDALPPDAAAYLAPPDVPTGRWKKFDERQLPTDAREMVLQAREVRKRAEASAQRGLEIARIADEAATEARRPGAKASNLHVFAMGDFEYAGSARPGPGGQLVPSGPGVLTQLKGERAGAQMECLFSEAKPGMCFSEGRLRFAGPREPNESWLGSICESRLCEYGEMTTALHEKYYTYADHDTQITWLGAPVDGKFSVVEEIGYGANGQANGLAVKWSADSGAALHLYVWEAGKFKADRTGDLIGAR